MEDPTPKPASAVKPLGIMSAEEVMAREKEEEEEAVQTLASGWNHWWTFCRIPLVVVSVDLFVFALMGTFDYWLDRTQVQGQEDRKVNPIAVAVWLLVNSVVFVVAARHVEKEELAVAHEEEQEEDESTNKTALTNAALDTSMYAKTSKRLDAFLGYTKPPRATTFVSVLYVAATLAGSGAFASLTLPANPQEQCSKRTAKSVREAIPEGLQGWAQGMLNGRHRYPPRFGSADFIHMTNGFTFFTGHAAEDQKEPKNDDRVDDYEKTFLVSSGPGGSLKVHHSVVIWQSMPFQSIEGDATNSDLFCGHYALLSTDGSNSRYFGREYDRMFCVSSSDSIEKGVFRNISLGDNNSKLIGRRYLRDQSMTAYEGDLWFAINWGHFGSKDTVEFYKINAITMQLTSVVNVTQGHNQSSQHVGNCLGWDSYGMAALTFFVLTSLGSCWLLTQKHIPAGVSPLVVSTCWILYALDPTLAACMVLLGLLASTAFLAVTPHDTKYSILGDGYNESAVARLLLDRESILFAHYSVFAFYVPAFFVTYQDEFMPLTFLGMLIGTLLNHPVLQVSGVLGAIVCGGWTVLYMLFGDGSFGPNVFEMFMPLIFCIIIGCGMFTAGQTLHKYRPFLKYHCRRMGIKVSAALSHDSSADPGRNNPGENDLYMRLIVWSDFRER